MITAPTAPAPSAKSSDFGDLVNLLDRLTAANNELDQLNASLNEEHLNAVRFHADKYKKLQTDIGEITAAIEIIAPRNPQWFAEKKTIDTPFGVVKRTTSTSLIIADEALSITLIEAAGRAGDFVVMTKTVSREALEDLGDDELRKFGISRKTEHNYKVAPATVELGKAVKAAEKSDKASAKTAKKAGRSES